MTTRIRKQNGEVIFSQDVLNAVSELNSTSTPLGAGASFTGGFQNVKDYATVVVSIISDKNSATDGLNIEWSSDGVNVDNTDDFTFITTETGNKVFTFGIYAQFVRVRYTNGATPQTFLRIQTLFLNGNIKPSSHRIADAISGHSDAELVRAVVTGQDVVTGQFSNVQTNSNQLLVRAELQGANTTVQGKRFITSTGVQTKVGASEEPLVLIRNPSGNTKNLNIDRQFFISVDQGVNLIFRVYRSPVLTSTGTALTPANALVGSSIVATGQMFLAPTVSSNGSQFNVYQVRDDIVLDQLGGRVVIQPNNSLLVTVESSGNNKRWSFSSAWIEELI
jgi:hypothetical protein